MVECLIFSEVLIGAGLLDGAGGSFSNALRSEGLGPFCLGLVDGELEGAAVTGVDGGAVTDEVATKVLDVEGKGGGANITLGGIPERGSDTGPE